MKAKGSLLNLMILVLISFLFLKEAFAKEGLNTSTSKSVSLEFDKENYQTSISYELSRSIDDQVKKDLAGTLGFTLSHFDAENPMSNTLRMYLVLDQFYQTSNQNNEKQSLRDLVIEYSSPTTLFPFLEDQSLSLQIGFGNSELSKSMSRYGSLAVKYSYFKNLGRFQFSQFEQIKYSEFDQQFDSDGNINKPWSLRISQSLNYSFSSKLSLGIDFFYDLNRSFQGVLRDLTSSSFSVSYSFDQYYTARVGLSSLYMSTKSTDGIGNDIKFYDNKSPATFISIAANY